MAIKPMMRLGGLESRLPSAVRFVLHARAVRGVRFSKTDVTGSGLTVDGRLCCVPGASLRYASDPRSSFR